MSVARSSVSSPGSGAVVIRHAELQEQGVRFVDKKNAELYDSPVVPVRSHTHIPACGHVLTHSSSQCRFRSGWRVPRSPCLPLFVLAITHVPVFVNVIIVFSVLLYHFVVYEIAM